MKFEIPLRSQREQEFKIWMSVKWQGSVKGASFTFYRVVSNREMIFIFIDGFGIGKEDASVNPLANPELPNINYILNKAGAIPTDACLDVPGLPQSATGQTTIFTGQNASRSCPGICTDNHNYTEEDDN